MSRETNIAAQETFGQDTNTVNLDLFDRVIMRLTTTRVRGAGDRSPASRTASPSSARVAPMNSVSSSNLTR